MQAKINWDVLGRRQAERQAMRYQRRKGFTRNRQGVVQRAKESWIDWIKVFGKDPKRRARKRQKVARQKHLRRLERDPKYAARCEKRRRDYVACLTGRERKLWRKWDGEWVTRRPKPILRGWVARWAAVEGIA